MAKFRIGYFIVGLIFLGLGIVGAILPLLPATPFLLVAAFAFSKSSKTFHDWLMNQKYLGPPIRDWQSGGAIRPSIKRLATVMILVSFGLSLTMVEGLLALKAVLALILIGVLSFIWTRPNGPVSS